MAISLTVKYSQTELQEGLQSYDLKVEILAATEMSSKIFILQRGSAPAPVEGEVVQDRFICIADPVDLLEVPEDAPDLQAEMPYYRTDMVTLSFRSLQLLADVQELIDADIKHLVRSMKLAAVLVPTSEVVYD